MKYIKLLLTLFFGFNIGFFIYSQKEVARYKVMLEKLEDRGIIYYEDGTPTAYPSGDLYIWLKSRADAKITWEDYQMQEMLNKENDHESKRLRRQIQ